MARSTLFDIRVGIESSEPSHRPQIGDMAIASWVRPELREKVIPGRRFPQTVTVFLEKFYRGHVLFTPEEALRISESAAGLEDLLHDTAPIAPNYHLADVYHLGHKVVGYANLDWLHAQEDEYDFAYEKHGPNLILDPSLAHITVVRDGAQPADTRLTIPPQYTVDPTSPSTLH